jgi:hypothetical protein
MIDNQFLLIMLSFMARGSLIAASCATWVAIPELYPTKLRGTGHSLANMMNGLGAFSSPYVVYSDLSIFTVGMIFAIVNGCSFIAVMLLPETAGQSLDHHHNDRHFLEDALEFVLVHVLRVKSVMKVEPGEHEGGGDTDNVSTDTENSAKEETTAPIEYTLIDHQNMSLV